MHPGGAKFVWCIICSNSSNGAELPIINYVMGVDEKGWERFGEVELVTADVGSGLVRF